MKSTSAIALVASLLPIVLASPLNIERDAEADVEYHVVTNVQVVTAYETAYYTEGVAPASTTVAPVPETTTVPAGKGRGRNKSKWTWTSTVVEEPAAVVPPTSTSTPEPAPVVVVVSTPEAPAYTPPAVVAAPEPTSTYVAPAPVAPSPSPVAASGPSAYTGDDAYSEANLEAAAINSTNTYRAMFQANPVAWNQSLVDMAKTSAAKCDFEHSNAGQNLAAGYSGPQGAVGGWGDEYKTFDFSKPDFSAACGHFTQLVWQDTTTIGCAAKKCPTDGSTGASGWYLICNYFPVGNMLGEFSDNVKTKISS